MRSMRIFCLSLMLLMLVPLAVLAKGDKPLVLRQEVRHGRLRNGLTYYIWPNAQPKGEAVYRLLVRSGSLNEDDDQQGLAHFLEHMAFNGSRHFPADGMVRFLESKGARFGKDLNAHTTFDETVYKLQLPCSDPAVVDSTLLIMRDWIDGLTFDPVEVEKERGVILSEWLTKQRKGESTQESLLEAIFADSRYALRPTIGDTSIIAHADREVIDRYYRQWYRPDLMAIAIVGDIDADVIEGRIRQMFGDVQKRKGGYRPYIIPSYDSPAATIATAANEKEVTLEAIIRMPAADEVMRESQMQGYALRTLVSRLIKRRFSEYDYRGQAYKSASMGRASIVRGGDLLLMSVATHRDSIQAGISSFFACQQQMVRYGFSQQEIDKVRYQMLQELHRRLESGSPKSSSQYMDELYNDYMRQMRAISEADELRLMERYLPTIDSLQVWTYMQQYDQHQHTHYLLHGHESLRSQVPDADSLLAIIGHARHQQVAPHRTSMIQGTALARPVEGGSHIVSADSLPDIQSIRWRLDNGSDVIYRQSHLDHQRLLVTGFREGGLYHLDSLDYQTALVGSSIITISGAGDFDQQGLADFLTDTPVRATLLVDKNRTGISGSTRPADIERFFELLYTKWTQPRVDSVACRRILDELRKGIRTRVVTPADSASRLQKYLLSGQSYVTRPMTEADCDQIDSTLMLPLFHRLFGSAEGYHFILAGDVPADSLRPWVDRYIGSLPSGAHEFTLQYREASHLTRDTVMYSPTEQDKATVNLLWQGIPRQPDGGEFSLQRYNMSLEALQGVIQHRLRAVLREEMGKTYSVSVKLVATLHPDPLGRMVIAFSCKPEDVDVMIDATRQILQQIVAQPESYADVLQTVGQNLRKQQNLNVQRNVWWTGHIRNLIYNQERDWRFATHYNDEVDALTMPQLAALLSQLMADPCLTSISQPIKSSVNE